MNDDTPTPFNRDLDTDLDYGDWQAEQAYEKYVADQEAAVETDSEPTTLHTGLEDTAADEAPVAVKRHPGTPSPSLQEDEAMRQERIAQPYLDMERAPRASLPGDIPPIHGPSLQDIILDRLAQAEMGPHAKSTLAAWEVIQDQLGREGRQPPPMTAEQERRFFDAR